MVNIDVFSVQFTIKGFSFSCYYQHCCTCSYNGEQIHLSGCKVEETNSYVTLCDKLVTTLLHICSVCSFVFNLFKNKYFALRDVFDINNPMLSKF